MERIRLTKHATSDELYKDMIIWLTTGGIQYSFEWSIETRRPYYIYLNKPYVDLFKMVFCIN